MGTITDDDPPPALSINDVTVTEGNSGTVNATFTVTLSAAERADGDGRLRDGGRHRDRARRLHGRRAGTLTFDAGPDDADGQRHGQRRHARRGQRDLLRQPLEPGRTRRSPTARASGTITDDDAAVDLDQRRDASPRATPGNDAATFTVTLSAASGADGDGRLRDGRRHRDRARRLHGDQRHAHVHARPDDEARHRPVNGDTLDETDETYFVNLSTPVNATTRRRAGRRHDHRRRSAAHALDQRRDRGRGQHRHGQRELHGHPLSRRAARP